MLDVIIDQHRHVCSGLHRVVRRRWETGRGHFGLRDGELAQVCVCVLCSLGTGREWQQVERGIFGCRVGRMNRARRQAISAEVAILMLCS